MMKNFNILGLHRKIWLLRGEFMKNQYRGGGGGCLKRGACKVCGFNGGGLARKRKVGVDTPMHTMINEDHTWVLKYKVQQTKFFVIFGHFLPFQPPDNKKNFKIGKKKKKTPGDIIILHICTTNDNHDVWFLRYGAQKTEFFVILDHVLPF